MDQKQTAHDVLQSCGLMAMIALAVSVGLLATHRMRLTPDSMRYALVSQEIVSSGKLRYRIIPFEASLNQPDANGTVAMLEQPPMFPMLLALLGSVEPDRLWPARVVNVCSHVVIAVVSMLMASHFCGRAVGFLVGVTVTVMAPLVLVCHFCWSESLFTALLVCSVWFLLMSRRAGVHSYCYWASGFFAAAAIATRFAGVALLPLFLWDAVRVWKSVGLKKGLKHPALSGSVCVVVIAGLLIRNLLLSGSIRGFDQPSPGCSWFDVYRGMVGLIGAQCGIRGFGEVFCSVTVIGAIAVSVAVCLKKLNSRRYFRDGFDLILLFMGSYTLAISYAMLEYQPRFEYRFMTPLLPFILVWVAVIADIIFHGLRRIGPKRIARYGIVTFFLLLALSQGYRTFSGRRNLLAPGRVTQVIINSQTYRWLVERCPADSIVATNAPYEVAFYAERAALRMPSRDWNSRSVLPEDMETKLPQRMSQLGARYLVLFASPEGLDEQHFGSTLAALSRREAVGQQVVMVYECPDGVVYECGR